MGLIKKGESILLGTGIRSWGLFAVSSDRWDQKLSEAAELRGSGLRAHLKLVGFPLNK